MDENNTYINKSEKEALEIMENVSDITSDQLQALRENEECFQTCSDIAEAVIGMQMEKNTLSINTQQALADFHRKHLDRRNKKLYILWTSVAGVAATIIIILVLRMMSFSPESVSVRRSSPAKPSLPPTRLRSLPTTRSSSALRMPRGCRSSLKRAAAAAKRYFQTLS